MTAEFDRLLVEMKPFLGRKAESLRAAHTLGSADTRKELEAWLQTAAERWLEKRVGSSPILLSPPERDRVSGPYEIGKVMYHDQELFPAGIDERALMSHVGVFGRTGTGKTNFCLSLLRQLRERGIPNLIFDWKRNYRDQLSDVDDLRIYTVGRSIVPFAFQPLIPPEGTSPSIWLKLLIDIIAGAYYVGEGVKYLLMKAIDTAYRESGVYAEKTPKRYPTFRDVLSWLEEYKPANARESQWMISTLRTLQSLCYGEMGRVVNAAQLTPMQDLLRGNVVLELDALTQTDKTFLTEALLLWIHHYRMQEGGRETLKHVIVVEEAHHVLKEGQTATESIMEVTLREIRELGQGIVLIDQTPSQMSPTALANIGTTVFLNLPHRSDITTASAALLLSNEQKDFLGQLPVGTAIVKLHQRHFLPFLVRIPFVRIKKGTVSDDDLKMRFQPKLTVSTEQDDRNQENSTIPQPVEELSENRSNIGIVSKEKRAPVVFNGEALSKDERAFIEDVLLRPVECGVHARYRRMRLSTRKGQLVKDAVVRRRLLEPHEVELPRGKVLLFNITLEGRRLATRLGLGPLPPRNWRPAHEFWRRQTARTLEGKGYRVEHEVRIPGDGFVDLCATKGNERLAVEVETGASDMKGNLRKALEDGFTGVVLVAATATAQEKLERLIERLPAKRRGEVSLWTAKDVFAPST